MMVSRLPSIRIGGERADGTKTFNWIGGGDTAIFNDWLPGKRTDISRK